MFSLAKCADFVRLRQIYDGYFPSGQGWGLKQSGKLFVLDQICKRQPKRVLEVGGGLDTFFAQHFAQELEFWMIDSGDLYPDPDSFRRQAKEYWKNTRLVDGLLGDGCKQLKDNYFDFLFSISALEHTPRDVPGIVDRVCKDMFRILRPGGIACHTIDIVAIDDIAIQYRDALLRSGFSFVEPPESLDWDVGKRSAQILLETLETAVTCYYATWVAAKQPIYDYHFGSVQVVVTKPL